MGLKLGLEMWVMIVGVRVRVWVEVELNRYCHVLFVKYTCSGKWHHMSV